MGRASVIALVVVVGLAGPGTASAQQPADAEQVRVRQRIFIMEGILKSAVEVGIDTFRRQLRGVMPDDMLLIAGDGPQARGFRLEGYGVFFDVEVPAVRPTLAWSLRTMNETASLFLRDVAQMRERIRQAVTDDATRAELERGLARIQQQVAPAQQAASEARAPEASQPSPAPHVDPGVAYTQAVKTALVDAMVDNSGSLAIGAGEWLTVAARDNSQGGGPASDFSEVTTVVLRIKGSDIAAFRAGMLTADEVRQRIEISSF